MLSPYHDAELGSNTVKYNRIPKYLGQIHLRGQKTPARERIQITSKITHITHCASCANGTILPTLLLPHNKRPPNPTSLILRTLYSTECPSRSSISKCRARLISPSPRDKPAFTAYGLDFSALAMRMQIPTLPGSRGTVLHA